MTKEEFRQFTENEISILDGATGSNLIAAGMPQGVCVEDWILNNPDVLINLQDEYIKAGSSIILAPTFGANRIRLASMGRAGEVRKLNMEMVKLSRSVADAGMPAGDAAGAIKKSRALVAGDISMSGKFYDPDDEDEEEDLVDAYREQAEILAEAGCDLILIETMISLDDAKAALKGAKLGCNLPVMASISFEANEYTIYGNTPEQCAKELADLGADAVGANCSTGPSKMKSIIERMAKVTSLPLIAKPNAGLPMPGVNGQIKYDLSDDAFAVEMMGLLEAGANILGGCCGTTPSYIEKMAMLVRNMNFKSR